MRVKPAIPRDKALRDVDIALDYYLAVAPARVAQGFVTALKSAYTHLSHHPASGSPRYAHEMDLPGLRSWPLNGYPYLVFYVERDQHLDVWRVLHMQQQIPDELQAT